MVNNTSALAELRLTAAMGLSRRTWPLHRQPAAQVAQLLQDGPRQRHIAVTCISACHGVEETYLALRLSLALLACLQPATQVTQLLVVGARHAAIVSVGRQLLQAHHLLDSIRQEYP